MTRKIIHIDADAFYASVEERDNPSLKTRPIAVGGAPGGRGVVATCNYLARGFGVHSAMPSSQAIKLCPELIFIKPRFDAYRLASKAMHAIFKRYTEIIEPLSLDEAYLDVSQSTAYAGSATRIAQAIQQNIQEELQLSVSAGVAPNKFLAKVASDWRKPHGIFVITPDNVSDFVATLPVKKINGVGTVTAQKLHDMGIHTCAELLPFDQTTLTEKFGKYGVRLYELARGIDQRSVQVSRVRKSLSVERTLDKNINDQPTLTKMTNTLYEELLQRCSKLASSTVIKGTFVKLKFGDFTQTTLEHALDTRWQDWKDINKYQEMMTQAWQRQNKPIRLVGLGIRLDQQKEERQQLELFSNAGFPTSEKP